MAYHVIIIIIIIVRQTIVFERIILIIYTAAGSWEVSYCRPFVTFFKIHVIWIVYPDWRHLQELCLSTRRKTYTWQMFT